MFGERKERRRETCAENTGVKKRKKTPSVGRGR
jgi:hypothetical protein